MCTAAHGDALGIGPAAGRFTRQNLELVLGVPERVLKGTLIKHVRRECDGHGGSTSDSSEHLSLDRVAELRLHERASLFRE